MQRNGSHRKETIPSRHYVLIFSCQHDRKLHTRVFTTTTTTTITTTMTESSISINHVDYKDISIFSKTRRPCGGSFVKRQISPGNPRYLGPQITSLPPSLWPSCMTTTLDVVSAIVWRAPVQIAASPLLHSCSRLLPSSCC